MRSKCCSQSRGRLRPERAGWVTSRVPRTSPVTHPEISVPLSTQGQETQQTDLHVTACHKRCRHCFLMEMDGQPIHQLSRSTPFSSLLLCPLFKCPHTQREDRESTPPRRAHPPKSPFLSCFVLTTVLCAQGDVLQSGQPVRPVTSSCGRTHLCERNSPLCRRFLTSLFMFVLTPRGLVKEWSCSRLGSASFPRDLTIHALLGIPQCHSSALPRSTAKDMNGQEHPSKNCCGVPVSEMA